MALTSDFFTPCYPFFLNDLVEKALRDMLKKYRRKGK